MTKRFDVNRTLDNLGDGVGRLIDLLTTYGWTVAGAGDGTNYSNAASTYYNRTVLNGSSNSGAACWVRIDHTATGRELLFYRGAGANRYHNWVVSYSLSAGFTGGSPSATVPPTATDQQYMVGSASTTVAAWLNSTDHADGSFHGNFCVDDAAPYGFYMMLVRTGGGRTTRGGHIVMDPLDGVSANNTDPYIFYVPKGDAAAGTQWRQNTGSTGSSAGRSMNHGAANMWAYNGASWLEINTYMLYSIATASAGTVSALSSLTANDPYTSTSDTVLPLFIGNSGTSGSYLGNTTWMKQSMYQDSGRSQGTLLTLSSAGDYIYTGPDDASGTAGILVPWNNTVWTG